MSRKAQAGAFLVMAIVILTVLGAMTVALGYLSSASTRSAILQNFGDKAFYVAFSGLERATAASADPVTGNRTACATQTGFSNVATGAGVFTVTNATVAYNGGTVLAPSPTTLSAGITATSTVIPVASLAGYVGTGGRIMIDREMIDYAATSTSNAVCGTQPCFVVARRGAEGTTAATHASATRVGAYQCETQIAGGVPDLSGAPTSARRTLTQATQLPEVWLGGTQAVAGTMLMNRFQETAWSDFNTGLAITHAAPGINSISMLSYADGFAVGTAGAVAAQQPLVMRWSGSAWAVVNTALNVNRTLNAISCVSANDCWAVGASGPAAAQPWIIRWNGAWLDNQKGPLASTNTDLNAIYCAANNECWAVGNSFAGNEYFIQLAAGVWTKPAASAAIADVDFNGLHCIDTANCWAVGAGSNIVRLSGGSWATEAIGGAAFTSILRSVWCTSATDCWAVGDTPTAGAAGEVILRRQSGAAPNWTRVAPVAGIPDVNLTKVACASSNDCWAVGVQSGGELILRWNPVTSVWARFGPSGTVTDRNLGAIGVIGPASRPYSARQELFP
jgi:hypothetical protein